MKKLLGLFIISCMVASAIGRWQGYFMTWQLIVLLVVCLYFWFRLNQIIDTAAAKLHRKKQLAADEKHSQQSQSEKLRLAALHRDPTTRYQRLETMLKARYFSEADQETLDIMLCLAGRTDYFRKADIEAFPCEVLQALDGLWLKYSRHRFGFSIQKKIWHQGAKPIKKSTGPSMHFHSFGWRPLTANWSIHNYNFTSSEWKGTLPFACIVHIEPFTHTTFALRPDLGAGLYYKDWARRIEDGMKILIERLDTCHL